MSALVDKLKRLARSRPVAFRGDAEALDALRVVIDGRSARRDAMPRGDAPPASLVREATRRFHERFARSADSCELARVVKGAKLRRVESEILLALALKAIGFGSRSITRMSDIDDVQSLLAGSAADALEILRTLSPEGRLVTSGLVSVQHHELLNEAVIELSDDLVAAIVGVHEAEAKLWEARTHDDLLDRCRLLVSALTRRGDCVREERAGMPGSGRIRRATSRLRRMQAGLRRQLERHPEWPLAQVLREVGGETEALAFVALLGVELGHVPAHDALATGAGLAESLSEDVTGVRHRMATLRAGGRLRAGGFVRIAEGPVKGMGQEDDALLAECTFEVSREMLVRLGLSSRALRRAGLRAPRVRLDELVLAPQVESALRLAIVQVRDQRVLVERWGLGGALHGGRATTLLFWGPPGVGKTASAEALAHELGKPLLVVDHAQLQSAWVGETEKNMARAFRDARDADAVLLLDEADAFLMNRDGAEKGWEIRWTNTLLQEIERFEGVLVLATNRQPSLDPALARRIALKVGFERPRAEDALRLWESLIPSDLPLAEDVRLEELAEASLSGGEIRNAVLNAARLALLRGVEAQVTMGDLRQAVSLERGERVVGRMGFG